MPTISTSTTITLPAGQKLVISGAGATATATVNPGSLAQIYDVGVGQDILGPFDRATPVRVDIRAGSVTYNTVSEGAVGVIDNSASLTKPDGSPASGGGAGFVKNETTGFAETTIGSDTFLALPKSGNNARANINVRTGTFAALSTLVGGNGEIAKCTDQEVLFAYDGVTPGGIVFRSDSTKGVVCTTLISDTPSSGGNAENMPTDTGTASLAKGTLTAPNASGIFTLNDLTGWLKITGYIFQTSDFNAGASHQLLLLASDAIGGPYSVAFELDLPPTLSQTPVNVLFPLSSLGSVPAYIRFQIKNTSVDNVFGNASLCLEHIA